MSGFQPTQHKTHGESLWRFLVLIVLAVAYFLYMSWKYDAATGAGIALLSWTFFVLCTPVADGGFVVAFPLRLLFGIRMAWTQAAVLVVAIAINIAMLWFAPATYDDAVLTRLLKTILTTPWPYWSILALSLAGTAFSIWFADEMMDVTTHKAREKHHAHGFKHRNIVVLALGVLTVLAYYHLLADLGVQLPEG